MPAKTLAGGARIMTAGRQMLLSVPARSPQQLAPRRVSDHERRGDVFGSADASAAVAAAAGAATSASDGPVISPRRRHSIATSTPSAEPATAIHSGRQTLNTTDNAAEAAAAAAATMPIAAEAYFELHRQRHHRHHFHSHTLHFQEPASAAAAAGSADTAAPAAGGGVSVRRPSLQSSHSSARDSVNVSVTPASISSSPQQQQQQQPQRAPAPLAGIRALVVDDAVTSRFITLQMLKRLGVTALHGVGSGREAERVAHEAPWDVVLLDMHLGDMTGVDVARTIRAMEAGRVFAAVSAAQAQHDRRGSAGSNTSGSGGGGVADAAAAAAVVAAPCVIVALSGDAGMEAECLEGGLMDAFLVKPASLEQIQRAVLTARERRA